MIARAALEHRFPALAQRLRLNLGSTPGVDCKRPRRLRLDRVEKRCSPQSSEVVHAVVKEPRLLRKLGFGAPSAPYGKRKHVEERG